MPPGPNPKNHLWLGVLIYYLNASLKSTHKEIMMIETRFDPEKKMSLETDASKLCRRLQTVNPEVTLDVVKRLIEADNDTKQKVFDAYSLNATQSWMDEVRSLLNLS